MDTDLEAHYMTKINFIRAKRCNYLQILILNKIIYDDGHMMMMCDDTR